MVRRTHAKKEIEAALTYAERRGWRIQSGGTGHAWGKMYCPYKEAECRCGEFCISSVWSTPKIAVIHARLLRHKNKKNTAQR